MWQNWGVRTVNPGPLIRGARNEDHPWYYEITAYDGWRGNGRSWNPDYPNEVWTESSGALNGSSIPLPDLETSMLYNQALERLNAKVRGSLDLSVSLAEGGQTKRMIASVAKTLNHARNWRNYVKKRFTPKNLREWVRDGSAGAANGWLQWTYGWKPLLGDVFGVLDERQRIVFNTVEKLKGRAGFSREVGGGIQVSVEPISGNNDTTLAVLTGLNKQSVTICVKLRTRDDTDIARWTSLNPVSIAYELMPYSFVIDWFYDVGSYLRNLETGLLYNSRFVGGYVSTLTVRRVEADAQGKASRDPREGIFGRVNCLLREASRWSHHTRFTRDMLTSYPMPHRPTFKVDMGSSRLLSGASLLRQLLK